MTVRIHRATTLPAAFEESTPTAAGEPAGGTVDTGTDTAALQHPASASLALLLGPASDAAAVVAGPSIGAAQIICGAARIEVGAAGNSGAGGTSLLDPKAILEHQLTAIGVSATDTADAVSRLDELSRDPAKNGKVTPGSIREAIAGLVAAYSGCLPQPITREATGASEFRDADGTWWDVKAPVSPQAGESWKFDAPHVVYRVTKELRNNRENVILDLSRVAPAHRRALLAELRGELTTQERERVVTVYLSELP